MINLETFFKNHFDTSKISDNDLRKFAQIHLQRMIANNTGGIYAGLITDTTAAYQTYAQAIGDEDSKNAVKEGSTIGTQNMLQTFKETVSRKEGTIRGEFGVDSGTYQEFFPHGVDQYWQANLANVETLMELMVAASTKYAGVLGAPFVTLFTNLRDDFKDARKKQLQAIGVREGLRAATAKARDVVEVQLMKNVLVIASNNIAKLKAVEIYFDQSFVRYKYAS